MQAEKKYINETDQNSTAQKPFNTHITDLDISTTTANNTTDAIKISNTANYGYVTMADYKLAPEIGDNFS